jgi:hypothetical protein
MVPNQYPYPVLVSGTLPVFTPTVSWNGYRIRVPKRDVISDTDTGILFVGTDSCIIQILNLGYG